MAKTFTQLTDTYADHVQNLNLLVNLVGNLSNLNPALEDSDLVAAINSSLLNSGTDSASVIEILDSAGYVAFGIPNDSIGAFVLRLQDGVIVGQKTFTENVVISKPTGAALEVEAVNRPDASQRFRISLDSAGVSYQMMDSASVSPINMIVMRSTTTGVDTFDFYTGAGDLAASIDSDGFQDTRTLMTRGRADDRYIKDSATVDQTNFVNVQSLIIFDSSGSAVKTIYGAGS